jgi:uncharacterized membrane protein
MATNSSAGQKAASLVVGMAIFVPGLFFMVLGVTFLPVIGIIMGLPVMALSIGFMMVSLKREVESLEVKEVVEQDAVVVAEMPETAPKEAQILRLPLLETDRATEAHPPDWKKAA